MLVHKAIYVCKHQTTCLFVTVGKITVTQPTPLSLVVLASCFNNMNLTLLILVHKGIIFPRNLALDNRLGRCKILLTSKLNHPHRILVVI